MAYWLFQGNPKYYRILDAIRDFDQMPWLVTRYSQEIKPGDGVLIWMSGPEAGLYAIAEVIGSAQVVKEPPDIGYWLDKSRLGSKPTAQLRFTQKLLDHPLLRKELMKDPVLKTLPVIRQPNSTNFRVTEEQWSSVYQRFKF
jgi:hypothetical protein